MVEFPPVVHLEGIRRSYNLGTPFEVEILHGLDLTLERGEFVALTGPSGSGKSTLLNIIGLLDQPTAGKLAINGHCSAALSDTELTTLRGTNIGFVFQFHCLITAFTALENVMMPLLVAKEFPAASMRDRARELLARMDLTKWENNLAGNMSGGQQQRVAIARALAMNPSLILADEPTGNLDTKSTETVLDMMRTVNAEEGTTFLIVTHNMELARRCDRIVDVVDGQIVPVAQPVHAKP